MDFNIFDGYSRIRDLSSDEDKAIIEALPDNHRAALFACIEHVTAAMDREERIRVARAAVRDTQNAYNAAVNAFDHSTPTDLMADTTSGKARAKSEAARLAAHRQVLAAQKPDYVPAKPVKITKSKAAVNEAALALTEARAELNRATGGLRALQEKAGAATNAWRACLTTQSAESVTREYLARGVRDRAARVAQGLPAHPVPDAPAHEWPLEAVMRARGKTKTMRGPTYFGPR
jgi:hypothetical protein